VAWIGPAPTPGGGVAGAAWLIVRGLSDLGLRREISVLPPLVVHPETHMAGELRWFVRERELASKCEKRWRMVAVEGMLRFRRRRQRRDIKLASKVVAISECFGQHLIDDYGLDPARVTVVPNPIDVEALQPTGNRPAGLPVVVAFVSRMSTRKGVDLVVALSHRLADLAGDIVIDLAGDHTLWSDYRPLLAGLHPLTARYRGRLDRQELIAFLRSADLLIQPAKFEPFGLTVGEALACGVPVVATTAVGAGEAVSPACCELVPPDDLDALEMAVRKMLGRIRSEEGRAMRETAREEAERLFSPADVASRVAGVLFEAAGRILPMVAQASGPGDSCGLSARRKSECAPIQTALR
jgi:glycosyltransferase involved in cell wall biosynthesis